MIRRLALAGLVILLTSTALAGQDTRESELARFFESLNEAATSGNVDAYTALFVPEGVMFLPNRPPLLGRDHIRRWFDDFQGTVTLVTASYEREQIDIVGDIAIVRSHGTGDYVLDSNGERIPANHKFMDILRYRDGSWRLLYHIVSTYDMEAGLWDRVVSQAFGGPGND